MSGDLAALIREWDDDRHGSVDLAAFLSARGVVVLDREQVARQAHKWFDGTQNGWCPYNPPSFCPNLRRSILFADALIAALTGPTAERCYTCNGWSPVSGVRYRETVGMVCQTCGTDYGAQQPESLGPAMSRAADIPEEYAGLVFVDCDRGHIIAVDDGDGGQYRCPACALLDAAPDSEALAKAWKRVEAVLEATEWVEGDDENDWGGRQRLTERIHAALLAGTSTEPDAASRINAVPNVYDQLAPVEAWSPSEPDRPSSLAPALLTAQPEPNAALRERIEAICADIETRDWSPATGDAMRWFVGRVRAALDDKGGSTERHCAAKRFGPNGTLECWLDRGHDGPHKDFVKRCDWHWGETDGPPKGGSE